MIASTTVVGACLVAGMVFFAAQLGGETECCARALKANGRPNNRGAREAHAEHRTRFDAQTTSGDAGDTRQGGILLQPNCAPLAVGRVWKIVGQDRQSRRRPQVGTAALLRQPRRRFRASVSRRDLGHELFQC